ncbi:hypothetical protein H2200_001647 [Cladophialophora chaetospira]|uniref:Nonribosomal peptide synthetase sidC n=1 Tax=Cladophialophora chaetospira TaxID=386627 RepID=A0AA38XLA3_9EURO|nr:hypothetical protein H2200_001647 [Cladophialophora chaetospira]
MALPNAIEASLTKDDSTLLRNGQLDTGDVVAVDDMSSSPNRHQEHPELSIINQRRQVLPGPRLLHELVARPSDESIALDFLEADGSRTRLTYSEFHRLTDSLSWNIRNQITSESDQQIIIPVIIPQCPELYLAWLAVLKSGAAFCPVSHDVPPERLKFILQDVKATFVLATSRTSDAFRDALSEVNCQIVSLSSLEARLKSPEGDGLHPHQGPSIDPSSPAYVMYTSGSTGLPKGVIVSHFSVSQSLLAHEEHVPHFKRFLQFASPTFDVSIFEIFFPLFRGTTLVGCERERMLADLPKTIDLLDADAAELTPTVAGTLLRTREAAPCLRTLLTIGEMLTPQVVNEFGGLQDRPSMLYAMYGPTEAAIHCTLAPKLGADASIRCIGRPLATVTAFVLKEGEALAVAPVEESGELAVAGQLADGYLNRPEQNQSAFLDLPGYGPIYKTGDRAICHSNGELEILGRMAAGQVKLRGQRVELGEIEQVASKTDGVQLAIAIIIDDNLVLFCAALPGVEANDIRSQCKAWLPSYMRPSEIIFISHDVPRLPSGKIDRKTIEHNYRSTTASVTQDEKFEDQLEEDIAKILTTELEAKLDRSTSFWTLGLDSLRAIKVASRLRPRYSSMSAAILSEADNVAQLAAFLRDPASPELSQRVEACYETSHEWQSFSSQLLQDSKIADLERACEKILPCSTMQVAMLVETTTNPAQNFNNIWLRLAPGVTFTDLRQAFYKLAQENEILRSGFVPTLKQEMPFVQIVWPTLKDTELTLLRPFRLEEATRDDDDMALVHIHHALYDGWSWDVILDDLNSILSDEELPKRTSFSKFRSFEARQLPSDASVTGGYWQSQFSGFKPSAFPNLTTTRCEQKCRNSIEMPLSVSYQDLSEFAASFRCGRETVLESAWALLLTSYANEADIAIGVVSAGRHHPIAGIESIIGPCLSLLPLRIDISALRTAHDLLNHIQKQRNLCIKHGSIPLRDINAAGGVRAGDNLFDTLCVWQQDSEDNNRNRSKVATIKTYDALDYVLVLEFEPRQGSIFVKLTFDATRIPESHAKLLAEQLNETTTRIMSDLDHHLEKFWELSSQNVLSVANTSFNIFSESFDLSSTVSRIATSDPERVAVEFVHNIDVQTGRVEKDILTYGDLFRQASIIASALRRKYDVRVDDLVCLISPRSIELYLGLLGAIMAGAAYICIDPRSPTERIRLILSQARCKLVITATGNKAPDDAISPVVSIVDLLCQLPGVDISDLPTLMGDELAYAVFTSGSTGVPKGVLITRRNLLSNIDVLSRIYPSNPETDRLLQSCSPAFDVSVFEIFWTWHMGMTLCTASNDVLFRDLEFFINKLHITHISMTPSVAALVRPEKVPHVKMLVTAGEPMNSKVFSDWANRGLYQGYGPSETTNICNVRPCVSDDDASNNVGPALPNTSMFICQRQGPASSDTLKEIPVSDLLQFQLVPKGGTGEIWVGGEQVGRGYIDSALTAKSFFDHPEYGRLYRSGDIGRLLADDSLIILGREDDQIKVRGHRIELGEISSVLVRSELIEDAISLVIHQDSQATARLVSFWTPRHTENPAMDADVNGAVYDSLSAALPSYMIPDALIRLECLPLTRQGKVDRRSLVAHYHSLDSEQLNAASRGKTSSDDADDLDEDEKMVAWALSDSLGVQLETVTRSSSFYALGLDSISAVHVARKLRDRFPSIEISTLLRNSSIGQLHRFLDSDAQKGERRRLKNDICISSSDPLWSQISEIYARAGLEVEKIVPCTPLQESMATTSTNGSFQTYWNIMQFKCQGTIQNMRKAWNRALQRHQILRTGFAPTDSANRPFVQVILKDFQLPWNGKAFPDIGHLDAGDLFIPPWNLTAGYSRGNAFHLTLQMHHCLYDAEAIAILLSEIEAYYHGQDLPPASSCDAYISYMRMSDTEETYQFWRAKLEGCPLTNLSGAILSKDRLPADIISLAQRQATIPLSQLHQIVRKLASTPLALFQAAWSRLLFCIFQTNDVCFGNVLSGRNLAIDGIDRLVAPCFNTLPVRARLQRDESNHDLCQNLQQLNVEMLPYQSSSLRRIQREVDTQGRALFDTLILLQQGQLQLDHNIWTLIDDSGDMWFPFILEILTSKNDNAVILKLHSEVANERVLCHLLNAFDSILVHTARYPQARASDYSSATQVLPSLQSTAPVHVGENAASLRENRSTLSQDSFSGVEKIVKDILVLLKPELRGKISKVTTIFHLGFDSINAVQIAQRLRKQGYDLSSGDILEAASVRNIASLCGCRTEKPAESLSFDLDDYDRQHRQEICQKNGIERQKVQHVWPCTPTQSGIISQYLRSNHSLYFNHIHVKLEPNVDLWRLQRAWATAMKLHKMLRTGFADVDDPKAPFAIIIYKTGAMQLPWYDEATDSQKDITDLRQLQWRMRVLRTGSSRILELSILHALYDASSLAIILDSVARVYEGTPPQKVDIAPIVSKILFMSRDETSKSFWSELSSEMRSTRFPDMRVYHNQSRKQCVTAIRSKMSYEFLQTACADAGATVQALVAAAWASLLSAYTAQDHVTIGVILSGRVFDEEENEAAFPCINTVPLALGITADKAEILQVATKRCAGVLRYQHTPLSTIKHWAAVEGELFDSVIVLQKYHSGRDLQRLWTQAKDDSTAEYAVSLEVLPQESGEINLQLTFRDDVVPAEQTLNILVDYEAMVTSFFAPTAENLDLPKTVLSVVPAKQERIPTKISYLHEFVEATAKNEPNSIALEFVTRLKGTTAAKQTWTYSELDANGNRIARLIQNNGIKIGELVAICFDKCPEASFAILGILKAGCGYIAIDPEAPSARKEFILQDSSCKLVLTTGDRAADFETFSNASAIAVDNNRWRGLSPEKPALVSKLDPQSTCYCLYTSGTTGTPKGCLISHDSTVQAMLSFQRIFEGRWNKSSRWLQFASFHFDVSVVEQFWSWSVGICVTSAPRDLLFEDLPGTISALNITHLDLTPTLARLLTPDTVPSLCGGVFILGGEQVRQDILETWGDTGCVYNFYGPSEVTIGCTVHRQVSKHAKPTNIGQQWDNVGSFVLLPGTQQPVLRGAVGELCLSGPLVGKGYLNRPELTAEKFVILDGYKTRIYRTGDLVRLLHDNSFEFLGRIDDQVKLRGQRLEIGEINHVAVTTSPSIKDVATLVLKHPTQQKEHLVTFFSTAQRKAKNEKLTLLTDSSSRNIAREIRKNCSESLPAYMVPTYIQAISYLPLSVNNKIDHKALKVFYEKNSAEAAAEILDEDEELKYEDLELSNKVVEILASFLQISVLDIKPVSRLFELGLDSISAIGLARAFKKQGFQNAEVALILRQPVVGDLAQALTQESSSNSDQAVEQARQRIRSFISHHGTAMARALGVKLGDIEHIAPCTALQEGMISTVMQSRSDETVYFSCFRFELKPGVDIGRLEHAWRATQRSVSVLRTFFVSTTDGYAQVVLRKCPSGVNVTATKKEDQDSHEAQNRSFDDWVDTAKSLSTSLPWKLTLMTSVSGGLMTLYLFHGLYDGVSLPLLFHQLQQHYDRPGEPIASPMQFYEALSHGPLRQISDEREFWSSRLPPFEPLRLALISSSLGASEEPIILKASVVLENLQSLCNKLDVTTSAFFQAVLLFCLCKQFNANASMGIVVSGRATANAVLEDVIGPLFNTVPCSINELVEGATVADLIQACHKFNVDIIPYQHTPLRKISHYISQDINKGLFDTLFVFQRSSADVKDNALWKEIPIDSSPHYPLNIEIEQKGTSFTVTVAAKPAHISQHDLKELITAYLDNIRDPAVTELILPPAFCGSADTVLTRDINERNDQQSDDETALSKVEMAVRSQLAELSFVPERTIRRYTPTIFELGLDSIEAMKLAARLKNIGLKVGVSAIMKMATVAGIALAVSSDSEAGIAPVNETSASFPSEELQPKYRSALQRHGLDLDNVECILPVTPMQEGLFLEPETYSNFMSFRLRPDTSVEKLAEAVKNVLHMHPLLRTRLTQVETAEDGAVFFQYVLKDASSVTIIHGRPVRDVVSSWLEVPSEQDLPDQKIHIAIVDDNTAAFLVLAMPHALYDAWSMHLLHQQIAYTYHSPLHGKIDMSGSRSIRSHLEFIKNESGSQQTYDFWEHQLEEIRPTIFGPKVKTSNASHLLQQQSRTIFAVAVDFCKGQGITLQSLGLTCWTLALAHYTGQPDVCFGVVLSGRTSEGSEQLVFPTFNTVLFRPQIAGDSTRAQALKQVHNIIVQVSEYQHFPLRKALNIARNQGIEEELFNTLFTFQKLPTSNDDLRALYDEVTLEPSSIRPPYPVNIELEGKAKGLVWTVAFQNGIADEAFGRELLDKLDDVMFELITRPASPVLENQGTKTSICGLAGIEIIHTEPLKREIELSPDHSEDEHDSPELWTRTELIVRDVLADVAKVEKQQIKKSTGIFHLGLDSVSAIRVASMLRRQGMSLPVSGIIREHTVENIAALAKKLKMYAQENQRKLLRPVISEAESRAVRQSVPIPEIDIEAILPAAGGQIYMLDMWRASGGRLFYPTFWLKVSGCSLEVFRQGVRRLVHGFPSLRTVFVQCKGNELSETWQVVLKDQAMDKYELPWTIQADEQGSELLFCLRIHHALYDAVSLQLLLGELERLCANASQQAQLNSDMASFLSRTGHSRGEQRQFWTRYLDAGQAEVPNISRSSFERSRVEKFNPKLLATARLSDQIKVHGLGIQALFFAAYAMLFSRMQHSSHKLRGSRAQTPRDVVVGVYLANRSLEIDGITALAAPTFNIVPLRVQVEGKTLLASALQVQRDLAEISRVENCGVSLRDIYSWTGVKIETFVNFLSLPDSEDDIGARNHPESTVQIVHAKVDREQKVRFENLATPSPFVEDTIQDPDSIEWCLPGIDIEAKVEDGYLGMGVFAPDDMLSEDEVTTMMEEMRKLLLDFQ